MRSDALPREADAQGPDTHTLGAPGQPPQEITGGHRGQSWRQSGIVTYVPNPTDVRTENTGDEEEMGKFQNRQQDGRFPSKHIHNHIKKVNCQNPLIKTRNVLRG